MVGRENDFHLAPLGDSGSAGPAARVARVYQGCFDAYRPLSSGNVAVLLPSGQKGSKDVLQGVGVAAKHAHDDSDVWLLVWPVVGRRGAGGRGRRFVVWSPHAEDAGPVSDGLDEGSEGVLHHPLVEDATLGGILFLKLTRRAGRVATL